MKKWILHAFLFLTVLLLLWVAHSAYSILTYSTEINEYSADVAIVLGAAAWGEEPSPVLRERVNHAIWLYENNRVKKIIFTGGKGDGTNVSEAKAARTYAIEKNVDPIDIFIETKSKITEENLRYAHEIGNIEGFTTYIIVSDPLHMKRAMRMAENTGMNAYPSATQTSAYQSWKTKIPFLLRELFFYVGYNATWNLR